MSLMERPPRPGGERWRVLTVFLCLIVVATTVACDRSSKNHSLDGSLLDGYNGHFDDSRIRLYSSELSVEYFRENGEVPVRVIVDADQLGDGPGSYKIPEQGTISGQTRSARIPEPTGGEIHLEEYEGTEGSLVEGYFSAQFEINETTVTLTGEFEGLLEIVEDVFEPEYEELDAGFVDHGDVDYLPLPDVEEQDLGPITEPDVLPNMSEPDLDAGEEELDAGPQEPDTEDEQPDVGEPEPDVGEPEPDVGDLDAGEPEPDAGDLDAGEPEPDTGEPEPDAGDLDAGEPEPDTGEPDTGEPDTGEPDTGEPDAGEPEPDTGDPDTGDLDAGDADTGDDDPDGGSVSADI